MTTSTAALESPASYCLLEFTSTPDTEHVVFVGRDGAPVRRTHGGYPAPPKQRDRTQVNPQVRARIRKVCAGQEPWPLVLLGEAGSGKTCTALCMIDHYGGGYITVGELCERVNDIKCGDRPRGALDDFWKGLADLYFVVVDELGERSVASDAHVETVKRLLDVRIDRPNPVRPTVFISNLTLARLSDIYPDPIIRRLASGTVLHTNGDQRVQRRLRLIGSAKTGTHDMEANAADRRVAKANTKSEVLS